MSENRWRQRCLTLPDAAPLSEKSGGLISSSLFTQRGLCGFNCRVVQKLSNSDKLHHKNSQFLCLLSRHLPTNRAEVNQTIVSLGCCSVSVDVPMFLSQGPHAVEVM